MPHLVADAVGAPAERQLREVAGADHQRAVVVGEAEQIVGAQPRLHVLEGDVVERLAAVRGVADIGQHLAGGRADVDLAGGDAERLHQPPGVGLGRGAGGEAGQGVGQDIGRAAGRAGPSPGRRRSAPGSNRARRRRRSPASSRPVAVSRCASPWTWML